VGKNSKDLKSYSVFFLVVFLVVVMVAAVGCGGGSDETKQEGQSGEQAVEPIIVKFSHVVADNTPKGQGAIKFKEVLESTSNGQFKVEVYPSSSLYGDKEETEALRANTVQLICPSVTKLVGMNPSFQIVDMPFLFKDNEQAMRYYDGEYGQKLGESLRGQGYIGLAWWPNGTKHWTNSKHPLIKPEDFKGLKFRTQSGRLLDDIYKTLGAGAQTMAFAEVYTALQNGTVDGQENTFNNIDTQKYEEVQKYMTLCGYGRIDYILLTNTTFFDNLTDEQKELFLNAVKVSTEHERQLANELNQSSYEKLKESGKMEIYELTDEERAVFIEALKPVYDKYGSEIGEEYLNAAINM